MPPQSTSALSHSDHGVLAQVFLNSQAASGARPQLGAIQSYREHQEIYSETGEANRFYKIISGVVRICRFLSDGRRQIESFHSEGEIFGLEYGSNYTMTAEAASDCSLLVYRRTHSDILSVNDPQLSQELLSFAIRTLSRAQTHSLVLGRRSAIEKVAHFLLECANYSKGGKTVIVKMGRSDIGDYLGLTIETISRTLSQMERDRLISLTNTRQIELLQPEKLKEICGWY